MKHRRALITIAAALILDLALGLGYAAAEHLSAAHGLYCAIGNAVTEGSCTGPASVWGYIIDAAEFLTVVPLFAATFSLVTVRLTADHVEEHGRRAVERLDHIIANHPDIPDLPDAPAATADGPVPG